MARTNNPKYIVVHHTGGTNADPLADTSHHTRDTIRNWHVNGLGWTDIGYHWVIEKTGKTVAGRPEHLRGAHCRAVNSTSIGVCVTGNFDSTMPTNEQVQALGTLLCDLMEKYDIPINKIKPHRFWDIKTCYGNKLSDKWAQDVARLELEKRNKTNTENKETEKTPSKELPSTPKVSNSTFQNFIKLLMSFLSKK